MLLTCNHPDVQLTQVTGSRFGQTTTSGGRLRMTKQVCDAAHYEPARDAQWNESYIYVFELRFTPHVSKFIFLWDRTFHKKKHVCAIDRGWGRDRTISMYFMNAYWKSRPRLVSEPGWPRPQKQNVNNWLVAPLAWLDLVFALLTPLSGLHIQPYVIAGRAYWKEEPMAFQVCSM